MASALSQPPSRDCRPHSPKVTALPRVALPFTFPRWFFRNFTRLGMSGIGVLLGVQIVSVVNPYLDADVPMGGGSLGKPKFNLGTQRGQGNAAVHAAFRAGHLGPTQPAGKLDPYALGPVFHRLVHGSLHGPPEAGALFQL